MFVGLDKENLFYFRDYVLEQLCNGEYMSQLSKKQDFKSKLQYVVFEIQLLKQPEDIQQKISTEITRTYLTTFEMQTKMTTQMCDWDRANN